MKNDVDNYLKELGITTSGSEMPYWLSKEEPIIYDRLEEDIKTDVVIVGGGIAGITAAYCLLKSGKKIALLEDGYIGSGETGRTTAQLVTALDDRFTVLQRNFGFDSTKLAAESQAMAIERVEEIITAEHIDCEFERLSGFLFLHPTGKVNELREEFELSQKLGIKTRWVDSLTNLNDYDGPAIEFLEQAQFHPIKYLRALAKLVVKMGGKIYTHSRVQDIQENGVTTSTGKSVKAKDVVVATNTPINDRYAMHTKQYPYRTYVIAGKVPKGKLPRSLWWDTGDRNSPWTMHPYHYIRLAPLDEKTDLLIIGGEDHRVAQGDDRGDGEERFMNLEAWAKNQFPTLKKVEYKWSGQVEEPLDSMAYLGKNPGSEHIYIITGDSGNGMTHTMIGATIITDLINGRDNKYTKIYDPSRITFRISGSYIKELGEEAINYIGDVLQTSEPTAIAIGEGGGVGRGFHKIALYRKSEEVFEAFSGICPHQKCVLVWNTVEKSFDCPCHGSRFSCAGKLINGPAIADLETISLSKSNLNI